MTISQTERSVSASTTVHPLTGVEWPTAPAEGVFNSPWTMGPPNCRDIRTRNGASFTLVREIWEAGPELDLECVPHALIRFADGLEIEALPEEINWGPGGALVPIAGGVL